MQYAKQKRRKKETLPQNFIAIHSATSPKGESSGDGFPLPVTVTKKREERNGKWEGVRLLLRLS